MVDVLSEQSKIKDISPAKEKLVGVNVVALLVDPKDFPVEQPENSSSYPKKVARNLAERLGVEVINPWDETTKVLRKPAQGKVRVMGVNPLEYFAEAAAVRKGVVVLDVNDPYLPGLAQNEDARKNMFMVRLGFSQPIFPIPRVKSIPPLNFEPDYTLEIGSGQKRYHDEGQATNLIFNLLEQQGHIQPPPNL